MEKKKAITAQLIGMNIRRLRVEHGETQQELGEMLGYGATTVANYESGYRMPDFGNARIMEILKCSESTATTYIKRMNKELGIIASVDGQGKGKYRFL